MAALSGEKTLAELSVEFGVHPTMISGWKAGEACGRAVRARQQGAAVEDAQKVIDDLHRKIGQLQVERDFLAGQPAISRLLRGMAFKLLDQLQRTVRLSPPILAMERSARDGSSH